MKIVPKGQDGAPLCPGKTAAFSAEDIPPGTQVNWSVLDSTCHALTVDNIMQPRTQGPDALLLAMPHDLAKGGALTLRATASGTGSPVHADVKVALHGFPVTWKVTFNELAVITPEKRPTQLRVGGHYQSQQDWFSAKANVILQVSCKRPGCSWRDLRVGWAQSVVRSYREKRCERGATQVRLHSRTSRTSTHRSPTARCRTARGRSRRRSPDRAPTTYPPSTTCPDLALGVVPT
jgi:hypothetical protein